MDTTTHIVLIVMIVVLGTTLTLVGGMLFFVLKDLRVSIARINEVLVDVKGTTERLSHTSVNLDEMVVRLRSSFDEVQSQLASPLGSVLGVVNFVRGLVSRKGGDDNE